MNYFCTLYDSSYSSRGFALMESLNQVTTNFKIYALAFDKNIHDLLSKLNFQNVVVVSLEDFEDEELLKIKGTRSQGEYCWTCTASIIKYCIENFNLDHCTYLDADLYFFSSPQILLDEMKDKSILITEHRYLPKYDVSLTCGKYCVQFMTFKNDEKGMKALNWWRDRCIEWCYSRVEDGKFGDQKYLDDWTTRFEGVHELQHIGGGVAPWNMERYQFLKDSEGLSLFEKNKGERVPLVFFHFQGLKIHEEVFDFGYYVLPNKVRDYVYRPYAKHLLEIEEEFERKGYHFNWHAMNPLDRSIKGYLRRFKRILLGNYNFTKISEIKNGPNY